jgi:heat shock protein HslJ
MDRRRVSAGVLAATVLAAGLPGLALSQDEPEATLSLEGVEWTLTTLASEAVPEGVEVTLFLSGGEVVGSAGCNSYFGSYELDGASLTFPTPFGATQKLCEEPAQGVEDAYLPLLAATATWAIDEQGVLSLSDAAGTAQLVYGEAPVDITASDVDALVATLADLQAQIDEATAEVAALAAATADVDVNRLDRRLDGVEGQVDELEALVAGISSANLRRRITTLEETVARLDRTVDRFRDRILALEAASAAHEGRITALEDAEPGS